MTDAGSPRLVGRHSLITESDEIACPDRFGVRTRHELQLPTDPVFYCAALPPAPHIRGGSSRRGARPPSTWRNATVRNAPGRASAQGLAIGTWRELIERHATHI